MDFQSSINKSSMYAFKDKKSQELRATVLLLPQHHSVFSKLFCRYDFIRSTLDFTHVTEKTPQQTGNKINNHF